MSETASNPFKLLRSTDLDETRGLVASIFCDHQLNLSDGAARLDYVHRHARGLAIGFSELRYGAAVHVRPQELDSFFLVQLPLSGHDVLRTGSCTTVSDQGLATVHGPGDAFCMNWSPDCAKLAIRIEREVLERQAARLIGRPLHRPLRFHVEMDTRQGAGRFWRQTVRQLLLGVEQGHVPLTHPLLRDQLEQLLLTGLLTSQPSTITDLLHGPTPEILPRHVKLAEDYMRAHLEAPITNELLADLAGVSVRTLQGGFQKYRGVSPMRHLRDLRMARVREELLDPSRPRSVTAVAMKWGFLELGRFSAEYRKAFGELPSCTLRRAG